MIVNTNRNPAFSGIVNPSFNSSINPNFNSSINPLYNTLINPNYSANFNGFYLWQWNSSALTGFVVRASNQVLLIYNLGVQWCSFGVVVSPGTVIQFDLNGNWIGTWISNGCGNYNIYASGMVLTGYTT